MTTQLKTTGEKVCEALGELAQAMDVVLATEGSLVVFRILDCNRANTVHFFLDDRGTFLVQFYILDDKNSQQTGIFCGVLLEDLRRVVEEFIGIQTGS